MPDHSEEPPLSLVEVERRHIARTLAWTGGNRREAARLLGVARSTLLAKIRRYQLDQVIAAPGDGPDGT